MSENAIFLADRLISEGLKSNQFFKELTTSQWEQNLYLDGNSWSPKQVLAHFLATEINIYLLLENILSGGEGIPEDFELDEFNQTEVSKLANQSGESMLDAFLKRREQTAALVRGLSGSELNLKGRHPYLGTAILSEIIKLIYRHNQIHQREIRAALKEPSGGES
jgi:hypothetical protein